MIDVFEPDVALSDRMQFQVTYRGILELEEYNYLPLVILLSSVFASVLITGCICIS